jgi:hypothetical protein
MATSISIQREYSLSFKMVLETFGLRVVENFYAKNLDFYVVY